MVRNLLRVIVHIWLRERIGLNKSSGNRGEKWESQAVTGRIGICTKGTVGAGDGHWTPANLSIPLWNSIVLPWNGEEVIVTYFGRLLVRIQLNNTFKTLIILRRHARHSITFNHYYYVIVIIKLINLILVVFVFSPSSSHTLSTSLLFLVSYFFSLLSSSSITTLNPGVSGITLRKDICKGQFRVI